MTTLEIVLIGVIWVIYGVLNSWQHDFYEHETESNEFATLANILLAPA